MTVSQRAPLPRFLEKGRGETVSLDLSTELGGKLPVTAATYTIRDAEGAVVLTGAASVASGVASYTLPSTFADATTLPQGRWRERWEVSGLSGPIPSASVERDVQLCRTAPMPYIDAEALFQLHPQWRRQLPRARADYGEPIRIAWEELLARLDGDGLLAHQILSWWSLSTVHKYWAAAIVCRDFMTDQASDSRWAELAETYWQRAMADYEHIASVTRDIDQDGLPDAAGAPVVSGPPSPDWRWG